ncbi:D-alanine--D-alanine ligase [Clostridium cavendishii]|nr:D-alanine--D-alanine ligase [Clostridium cavendishii]
MKVGVLMGGVSSEREISLRSGEQVVNNLDRKKYEVIPILLDSKKDVIEKVEGVNFAFIALHGSFGEDGEIQGILESLNIPYNGSGVLTSALCMNKKQSKRIMKSVGVNTAEFITVNNIDEIEVKLKNNLSYPLVVKPNIGGSSVATFIVYNEEELKASVKEALKYDKEIIIERYLKGEEYTVAILNGEALPIIDIKSKGKFFDFKAKYTKNEATEEIANISRELEKEIKELSIRCYEIFDCKAYARVDIIVSEGIPYVLEVNTLPGMTNNSLILKAAKAINLTYVDLLDKIIEYSLT